MRQFRLIVLALTLTVLNYAAFAQQAPSASPEAAARAKANQALDAGKSAVQVPGIKYTVLHAGPAGGAHPPRTAVARVHLEGSLMDGTVFFTSVGTGPADGTMIYPVKAVIPGMVAAVQMMRPGDEWLVEMPQEMAYGSGGNKLSGQTLFFKIGLVDFVDMPAEKPQMYTEMPKPPAK